MQPPPNSVYTVFSFVGFVMCAIPFYWHLNAWNAGTCLYMAWTGLGCLVQCINSIVWNKNMIDKAPIYSDIAVRIRIGIAVAIPACSLCITRRLYKIATANVTMATGAEKRRAVVVDLLIGFGIPILQITAQYVVSGHRYDIFEDVGPYPVTVNMPPAYFLVWAWPAAIGAVSAIYGVRTIVAFYKRERRLGEMLSSSYRLTQSHYLRLMVLASVDALITVPFAIFVIVANTKLGVTPWVSWDDTHSDYSRVVKVPSFIWKNDYKMARSLEVTRWRLVLSAFIFFAFFGFAKEARQHYRLAYRSIARRIGCKTSSGPPDKPSHVYVVQCTSLGSFAHAFSAHRLPPR
ncbi:GPCR fungal pheromone mating factor [Russula brevipes]|nr:GPCR fungal pheromone mating factor [Russula brevipes]